MAGIIGLRGPDVDRRDALRGFLADYVDADRPIIRPHTGAPVFVAREGRIVAERHVFGFSKRVSSFNARGDRLLESRMWSRMFRRGHGVAPVSYILEWSDIGDGKRPFRIERADGAAMAVPALVGAYWEDRTQRAFALVTVPPNPFVGFFHDRVVAQLDDDDVTVWLHPEKHDEDTLLGCLKPGREDAFVAYPLRPDVASADDDEPGALAAVGAPITWAEVQRRRAAAPKGTRQTTL